MTNIYLVPKWFFGYDIIFELAFAIITLLVSVYAFKIYKLTEQRKPKIFGISFLLISISYFIQSLLNYAILSKLNSSICRILKIDSVNYLNSLGINTHIFFFMTGLITLTYLSFNIKSTKILSILLGTIIISLIFSPSKLFLFYVLSAILLGYLVHYHFNHYKVKRQVNTLLVFLAFTFLFIGNFHFVFSMTHNIFYALGHFLELLAYLLILANLILVLKK